MYFFSVDLKYVPGISLLILFILQREKQAAKMKVQVQKLMWSSRKKAQVEERTIQMEFQKRESKGKAKQILRLKVRFYLSVNMMILHVLLSIYC